MKQILLAVIMSAVLTSVSHATPADEAFEAGTGLFLEGRLQEAAERLQVAIQEDPRNWIAYQNLGYVFYDLGSKDRALAAFKESLKLQPDNPSLKRLVEELRLSAGEVKALKGEPSSLSMTPTPDTVPAPQRGRELTKRRFNFAWQMGTPLLFGPKIGWSPDSHVIFSGGIHTSMKLLILTTDIRVNIKRGHSRPNVFMGWGCMLEEHLSQGRESGLPAIGTSTYLFRYYGIGYEWVNKSCFGVGVEAMRFQFLGDWNSYTFRSAYGGSLNLRMYL